MTIADKDLRDSVMNAQLEGSRTNTYYITPEQFYINTSTYRKLITEVDKESDPQVKQQLH